MIKKTDVQKNIYIKIREALQPKYRHMALPQTGAAVIVLNGLGQVLLLRKNHVNKWVIPGGVQELGEDLRHVAWRELLEETGIDATESDFQLIGMVTGDGRHSVYPNGDEVYNNTVLYALKDVTSAVDISSQEYTDLNGKYVLSLESTDYGWFELDNLPRSFDDWDLIRCYQKWAE